MGAHSASGVPPLNTQSGTGFNNAHVLQLCEESECEAVPSPCVAAAVHPAQHAVPAIAHTPSRKQSSELKSRNLLPSCNSFACPPPTLQAGLVSRHTAVNVLRPRVNASRHIEYVTKPQAEKLFRRALAAIAVVAHEHEVGVAR